jgi:alpha-1,3/alpha-1,6-mannosyltransferase
MMKKYLFFPWIRFLSVGGAEKLVVEAAVGLQRRGHKVKIFTSFHDPAHSFPETNDGTRAMMFGRLFVFLFACLVCLLACLLACLFACWLV